MILIETDATDGKLNPAAGIKVREYISKIAYSKINIIVEQAEESIFFKPIEAEKLIADIDHFDTLLKTPVGDSDVSMLLSHAYELSAWASLGATLQASALYYLNCRKRFAVLTIPDDVRTLSATIQNEFIKGECADYASLYERISKINSNAIHKMDLLRTQISYEKALIPNGNFNQK